MRTSQCSEGFYLLNKISSVHVWLVAISYLLLLHYSVPQTMKEDCGKCVVTHRCSMGFLYVANSMLYLLLCYSIYVK
jgi:hypothetical protein